MISDNSNTLVSVSATKLHDNRPRYRIDIIDRRTDDTIRTLYRTPKDDGLFETKISPQGRRLALFSDRCIEIVDVQTGKTILDHISPGSYFDSLMSFTSDGKQLHWLEFAHGEFVVKALDIDTGDVHSNGFPSHFDYVFSAKSDTLLYYGVRNTDTPPSQQFEFQCFRFSSSGLNLVLKSARARFIVSSSTGRRQIAFTQGLNNGVLIDPSSDGKLLQLPRGSTNWFGPDKVVVDLSVPFGASRHYAVVDMAEVAIEQPTRRGAGGSIWSYDRIRDEILEMDQGGKLVDLSVDGSQQIVRDDPHRFWPHFRVASIVGGLIWWLSWVWGFRRRVRSFQPLIDLCLLHSLGIAVCLLRFWRDPGVPNISYPESFIIQGIGISALCLLAVWFASGSTKWRRRFAMILLSGAPLWVALLLLGDQLGVSLSASSVLAISIIFFLFAISLFSRRIGIVLIHSSDQKESWKSWDRGFRIRDLFVWTFALAILLLIARRFELSVPAWEYSKMMIVMGGLLAVTSSIGLWINISASNWKRRLSLGILTVGLPYGVMWLLHADDFMLPTYWFVGLFAMTAATTILAGLSLRWNGYRLGSLSPETQPSKLGSE